MRQCFCIRLNNFRLFPRLAFKKDHHTLPSTNSWLMNALFVLHPCKTLDVQHRASLPVPCQREPACGKARLFQILLLFVTHATSKSRKPYLPSRLRDRRHRTFPLLPLPPLTIPQSQCQKTRFCSAHL